MNWNQFGSHYLGLAIFLSVVTFFAHTECLAEPWTVKKLVGLHTFHEGPNCMNAALVGKGYLEDLVYTDAIETRYYLEKFCKEIKFNRPVPSGALYIVEREKRIEHAMLALGHQFMFEKDSTAGLYSHYTRADNNYGSGYHIKSILDSRYVKDCKKDCKVKAYSCPAPPLVRSQLQKCDKVPAQIYLSSIRKAFADLTFSWKRDFSLADETFQDFQDLIQFLQDFSGVHECALFILVQGFSANWAINRFDTERKLEDKWTLTYRKLRTQLRRLGDRILAVDKRPETAKILAEWHYWNSESCSVMRLSPKRECLATWRDLEPDEEP